MPDLWTAAEWDRFQADLDRLAAVGVDAAGRRDRQPLTPADHEAVALVSQWLTELGCSVRRDGGGNLRGLLAGAAGGRSVATGSHLDTVPDGGALDGALGVVGAVAAVRHLLATRGAPRRPVEIWGFCGEEGARFPGGLLGSRIAAGLLRPADLAGLVDAQGVSAAAALRAAGLPEPEPPPGLAAFLELHLEQGPLLDARQEPVGAVTHIVGLRHATARVTGRADHAGTTPLGARRDALLAAAAMIVAASDQVRAAGPPTVLTCGRLAVRPNASNIVPAEVTFTWDLRDPDAGRLAERATQVRDLCRRVATRRDADLDWTDFTGPDPVALDPGLVDVVAAAAARVVGHPVPRLVSGAGHDAMIMARLAPTAMIFVRTTEGRSHSPQEEAPVAAQRAGVLTLAGVLGELAWADPDESAAAGRAEEAGGPDVAGPPRP